MKKFILLIIIVFSILHANAQSYNLHPLYIYSFTRYVQWPESSSGGDFEITVLGDSPIVEELNKMALVKKVGERSIKITKINSLDALKKCNILFVSAKKSIQLNEALTKVNGQSVLVITEEPGLGAKGSNINFVMKDGKLAFELNQSAFIKQNLKVSTELTRLAILI